MPAPVPRSLVVTCIVLGALWGASCAGGDDASGGGDGLGCPPASELLIVSASHPLDTNGDPNDLESDFFVDRNQDGRFDALDGFDLDQDGQPDDFNGDGLPDNRFYFDDRGAFVPDADSFDDFELPESGIPRGVTPVAGACPADGVETGPLDLGFETWKPSKCCRRM